MTQVRVRFAPSPTGFLHIGGVRTALFNWLFARQQNGVFVLRIEDTDQSRSTDESIQAIIEGMKWVRLDWDEGPFRQTERMDLYRRHAMQLLQKGQAYWCICKAEELDARRKEAEAKGLSPKYDGRCRDCGHTNLTGDAALRFKAPQEGETVVDDLIKGKIVFDNNVQDDLIILRSNGYPTYNFSVVVDDALMNITHVVRGDDHLTNTPRQVPIFQALGFPVPQFGHLPMILGSDKARLSKRHGATSIMAYKDMGYLPDAMLNYLVRLGWSHGDQELFTRQEMISAFDIHDVNKSASAFNPEKLLWLNQQHMMRAMPAALVPHLRAQLRRLGADSSDQQMLEGVILAQRERAKTMKEMAVNSRFFFVEDIELDLKAAAKHLGGDAPATLAKVRARLGSLSEWNAASVHAALEQLAAELGGGLGKIAQPLRVAVSGSAVSPPIDATLALLGRERTLARVDAALAGSRPAPKLTRFTP